MTLSPRTCAPQNMYFLCFQRRGSLHLSPRQSQTHSSQNYLISSASIPNPMAQEFLHPGARQNAMKWSVGMIILLAGAHMLFNRQSNCNHVLLDVPAHSYPSKTASLQAYSSAPQSLGANLNKVSLSIFLLRLSSFSLTFPDACSHFRDVWEQCSRSRFRVGLQERAKVIQ